MSFNYDLHFYILNELIEEAHARQSAMALLKPHVDCKEAYELIDEGLTGCLLARLDVEHCIQYQQTVDFADGYEEQFNAMCEAKRIEVEGK